MVKSEMGLDMDLSFFDEPAPPMDDGGEAGKTIQVPADVPMDSRSLESLKSHIDDEASKTLETMAKAGTAAEEEVCHRPRAPD
jgi:hypothetical protein